MTSISLLVLLFSCLLLLITSSSSSLTSSSATISRFQEYLRINTSQPTPNYAEAVAFLLSQAESIGLESQILEFSLGKPVVLLRWPGTSPHLPTILLNSHTDVVPSETQKWRHQPFSAAIDAVGNIYARGSQDMKCVGMQYLEAIRRIKAAGFAPRRTVYLSFVPDEEVGGVDGAKQFAESEVFRSLNAGIVLDEGLPSETDEFRVFYGEKSPWWLSIKAVGPPGHGSKLYRGSAIDNLQKSLEIISRFRESQFHLLEEGLRTDGEVVSVNLVFLKAGTPTPTGFVMNLQPSEAEMGLDIRVPSTIDTESLEKQIAEEWAPSSRNMSFQFKLKVPVHDMLGNAAITKLDNSNSWWMLLQRAVKKEKGKLNKPEIFPGATDARYFRQKAIPAIGFSPISNTPLLLHDHDEFLNQEVYLRGIKVYEAIIEAYASYEEPVKDEEALEGL